MKWRVLRRRSDIPLRLQNLITEKPKRRFSWGKLLLWIGGFLLIVIVMLALGLVAGYQYLASNSLKTFEDVTALNGGTVQFRNFRVEDFSDWPQVSISIRQLTLSDSSINEQRLNVVEVDSMRLDLLVDRDARPYLTFQEFLLSGGVINILADGDNPSNLARLLAEHASETEAEEAVEPDTFTAFAKTFTATFDSVAFNFQNPAKENDIRALLRHVVISDLQRAPTFEAMVSLDVHLRGMQFKEREGPWGSDASILGNLAIARQHDLLRAEAPELHISGNEIGFSADYYINKDTVSNLVFDLSQSVLAQAAPLLTPRLRKQIEPYHVADTFATRTTLYHTFRKGDKALVEIDIQLRGNDATVNGEAFAKTYLDATFYNRLSLTDSTYTAPDKGVRLEIDSVVTTLEGFDMSSRNALVTATKDGKVWLNAHAYVRGEAKAVSKVINSDQFVFSEGEVFAEAWAKGPPTNMDKLIELSDADFVFNSPSLHIVDAGVRLPFKYIRADKRGDNTSFELVGSSPRPGHTYHMSGELKGVGVLLRGGNQDNIRSYVKFTSDHMDWFDVRDILGQSAEPSTDTSTTTVTTSRDSVAFAQIEAMKKTIALIEATFRPTLDVSIDTVAYYDFAVHDFTTGLHFDNKATMVLERTSFRVDSAMVVLDGELDVSKPNRTPFEFALDARHLNLATLLPEADYFGFELLKEFDPLPDDVDITIRQKGEIDDVIGIQNNSSSGQIQVVSNHDRPFAASIEFDPDRLDDPFFKSTRVKLTGSPELFNEFFGAEEFFFCEGEFDFSMGYSGLVPDLRTLLDRETMALRVDNSNVLFSSLGISVPITQLALDMRQDVADVHLFIENSEVGQQLRVDGVARNVSEVALGSTGKQFSTDVRVSSPRLVWADLNTLIGSLATDQPDTVETELNLRQNIREIMRKFRPDVDLRVDELVLNRYINLRNLRSGLAMNLLDQLTVDSTRFDYLDGDMLLYGDIDLSNLAVTPFTVHLSTDALDLASLLEGFDYFNLASLSSAEELEGVLSMRVDMDGAVSGEDAALLSDYSRGTLDFALRDLVVEGLGPIDSLAKKLRMRERLDSLAFAPITNRVQIIGDSMAIPLMEVQSNAFNVFLQGDVVLGRDMDLWISVPLNNLKKPDLDVIPTKQGWNDSRFKVHINLQTSEAKASEGMGPVAPRAKVLETKVRLRKRRYYKDRGRLDEWRALRRGKRVVEE